MKKLKYEGYRTIFNKKERWLLYGAILLVFVSPFILTRPAIWAFLAFNKTGQIGDTIGGITAPFVNLIAAYLVYKSFSAQIQANYQQQRNHSEQIRLLLDEQSGSLILNLYDRLEVDFRKGIEEHRHTGAASEMINGIVWIERVLASIEGDMDKLAGKTNQDLLARGISDIERSVNSVLFTYHSFLLLLNIIENSLMNSKSPHVITSSRYVVSKIQSLFNQHKYDHILKYDFEDWLIPASISEELHGELKYAKISAQTIRERIDNIFELTENKESPQVGG